MSGYATDTNTITLVAKLDDNSEVQITGQSDGVNPGMEWTAVHVARPNTRPDESVPVGLTVHEETLIDGITPADAGEGEYEATFRPEAWVNNYAVEVDPDGDTEWDCSAFAREHMDYLLACEERRKEDLGSPFGVVDNDDIFKGDPAAPQWVRAWRGPFTLRVRRVGA